MSKKFVAFKSNQKKKSFQGKLLIDIISLLQELIKLEGLPMVKMGIMALIADKRADKTPTGKTKYISYKVEVDKLMDKYPIPEAKFK